MYVIYENIIVRRWPAELLSSLINEITQYILLIIIIIITNSTHVCGVSVLCVCVYVLYYKT